MKLEYFRTCHCQLRIFSLKYTLAKVLLRPLCHLLRHPLRHPLPSSCPVISQRVPAHHPQCQLNLGTRGPAHHRVIESAKRYARQSAKLMSKDVLGRMPEDIARLKKRNLHDHLTFSQSPFKVGISRSKNMFWGLPLPPTIFNSRGLRTAIHAVILAHKAAQHRTHRKHRS